MVPSLRTLSMESIYNQDIAVVESDEGLTISLPTNRASFWKPELGMIQKEQQAGDLFKKACERGPSYLRVMMTHPEFGQMTRPDFKDGIGALIDGEDLASLDLLVKNHNVTGSRIGAVLCMAIEKGNSKVVDFIINHPRFQEIPANILGRALELAAKNKDLRTTQILLANHRCSEIPVHYLSRTFAYACNIGWTSVVKALISNSQFSKITNFPSRFSDASMGGHVQVVKALMACSRSSEINRTLIVSLFSIACRDGHVELVKAFLKCSRRADIPSTVVYSSLSQACENGHLEVVKTLLRKADVTLTGLQVLNLIALARENGHLEIIKAFLYGELPIQFPMTDDELGHILMGACEGGQTEIVNELIASGRFNEIPIGPLLVSLLSAIRNRYPRLAATLIANSAQLKKDLAEFSFMSVGLVGLTAYYITR